LVVVVVVGWVVRLTKRFGWWMYWEPPSPRLLTHAVMQNDAHHCREAAS
jgi:hypothetical protein